MANGHGGARPNSGRKSRADEFGLMDLLDEAWPLDARKLTIMALAETAVGGGKDAVKAAEVLLAYAYGKPRQALELSGPDGGPVAIDDGARQAAAQELAEWRRQMSEQLGSLQSASPTPPTSPTST